MSSHEDLEARLEPGLRAIGRRLDHPRTPDLWPAVERAIASSDDLVPLRPSRRSALFQPSPLRVLAIAAILLLILAGALYAFRDFRAAVADRLGLTGIVIRYLDEAPSVPLSPAGADLRLGREVTLAEAAAAVDFPLQVPTAEWLDEPETVYITFGTTDNMVSFVYRANEYVPPSRFTGVGALLTQFRGTTDRNLINKGIIAKGIGDDTSLEVVTVDGAPGYWIEGAAHVFLYQVPTGEVRTEEYRLASNVLLWEEDGITFRLESELGRQEALEIAESMQQLAAEAAGTNPP